MLTEVVNAKRNTDAPSGERKPLKICRNKLFIGTVQI